MKKHNILLIIILVLVIVLFVHHYLKHGYLFDKSDFANAVYYLFSSHEGLIVLMTIIAFGIFLGFMLDD